MLVARNETRLEELAGELTRAGAAKVEVLSADLASPGGVAAVVGRLTDAARPIDVLVNSAGFGLPLAFERSDIEDEARRLMLHVEVPMRLMHAALPGMLERRSGTILNISSVAAFMPRSTCGAVKSWQVMFSRWASSRYRSRGVTVTAVCPGYTHSEFHERLGLAPGEEGIPGWQWLKAPRVVEESLRDTARGKAASVPSKRCKAITTAAKLAPTGLMAKLAARER
ncbi:SDR family NAD(P)-dependent oxidoreductase [Brachybacterium paraconglomeratum]|uniref:SDR family NAD(P)-dependent oxidoreductase n=1 Tax=Brachybacterium paraconglomeratum TaxID=173362 RepID=UPI00223C473B|nr:SDR family NAD(P)-dependent oxidoreductase [Brachybacterium paraconglomeratum]MCT1435934.1 SDR family NAD(P)-dependent oxidoreductase [Brachybacterium paraconglomeratum]